MDSNLSKPTQQTDSPRENLKIVLIYAMFACAWILLSDSLLNLLIADRELFTLVSLFKGWIFVMLTSLLLYVLLQRHRNGGHPGDRVLQGGLLVWRRSSIYLVTVCVTLLTLILVWAVLSKFVGHPLLLALMLPIILSATLGGMGPGLVATLIGTFGTAVYAAYVEGGFLLLPDAVVPWVFLFVNGVLVSVLAELMRRSRMHSATAASERLQALKLLGCIAESSDDAIFAKDLEGRYQLFNQAASRLVGKPVENVLGQDAYALFSRSQADEIAEIDARVMRENRSITREEHLSTLAGERHLKVTIGPLHDSLSSLIGVFGVARELACGCPTEEPLPPADEEMEAFNQACKEYDAKRVMLMQVVNQLSAQIGRPMPFDLDGRVPNADQDS